MGCGGLPPALAAVGASSAGNERMRTARLLVAGLLVLGSAGAATAQDLELPLSLEGVSPDEANARLRFLDERLDAGRSTARAWQYGWTGAYGAGALAGAAQAVIADDGDEQVYNIVGAVKSAGALADLLT